MTEIKLQNFLALFSMEISFIRAVSFLLLKHPDQFPEAKKLRNALLAQNGLLDKWGWKFSKNTLLKWLKIREEMHVEKIDKELSFMREEIEKFFKKLSDILKNIVNDIDKTRETSRQITEIINVNDSPQWGSPFLGAYQAQLSDIYKKVFDYLRRDMKQIENEIPVYFDSMGWMPETPMSGAYDTNNRDIKAAVVPIDQISYASYHVQDCRFEDFKSYTISGEIKDFQWLYQLEIVWKIEGHQLRAVKVNPLYENLFHAVLASPVDWKVVEEKVTQLMPAEAKFSLLDQSIFRSPFVRIYDLLTDYENKKEDNRLQVQVIKEILKCTFELRYYFVHSCIVAAAVPGFIEEIVSVIAELSVEPLNEELIMLQQTVPQGGVVI